MTKFRPPLPKRLAARLRAAYSAVAGYRDRLAYIEAEMIDRNLYLKEFEDDPARFAELHYPSVFGGVDSYPVQANIAKTREWIDRKSRRMPTYLAELAQAESELDQVEREVLETLSSMHKDSSGRVAWPDEPESLMTYRREYLRVHAKNREHCQIELQKKYQRHGEEVDRCKEGSEAALREADTIMATNLSQMPPEKAAAYRSFYEAMRIAQFKDTFYIGELMRLAGGDLDILKPIIEDAKRRLMNDLESKD